MCLILIHEFLTPMSFMNKYLIDVQVFDTAAEAHDPKLQHDIDLKLRGKASKHDIIRKIIPIDMSSRHDSRFPFQFHIPDQLPSSMYHINSDGNGGHCAIRYKVKMHLRHGLDQEIPLDIISNPPSFVPHPSIAEPMLSRIQYMCCIPQGSVCWAARVDNTRIGVGEDLHIKLGIKNESLARLECVTAKLKQTVHWSADGSFSGGPDNDKVCS